MAIGLYGYSSLALDSKGRIAMPAKYKEALKEVSEGSLVVTRDPQYPSLRIYPGSLWKTISKAFENLSGLDSKIRSIQWNFLGYANLIDFEVNILISVNPEPLDHPAYCFFNLIPFYRNFLSYFINN